MHDYDAVRALVTHLTAAPDLAAGIVEVRVKAGAEFSAEALGQAYEMLTEDTRLKGSRLVVEELAERHECLNCTSTWILTRDDVIGHLVVCPSCGMVAPFGDAVGVRLVEVRTSKDNLPRPQDP